MINRKNMNSLLGIGLILIGLYIFFNILNINFFNGWFGLIGSVIIISIEIIFLFWRKNG